LPLSILIALSIKDTLPFRKNISNVLLNNGNLEISHLLACHAGYGFDNELMENFFCLLKRILYLQEYEDLNHIKVEQRESQVHRPAPT
jgi:hypothetical protein